MAKKLLASVLQRSFGEYIEGIDASNLRASVWSGKVQLNNLRLRRSALDALQLPVKLQAGTIGCFDGLSQPRDMGVANQKEHTHEH